MDKVRGFVYRMEDSLKDMEDCTKKMVLYLLESLRRVKLREMDYLLCLMAAFSEENFIVMRLKEKANMKAAP